MSEINTEEQVPHKTNKPGRLYPKNEPEWFKSAVEDSAMAVISAEEPAVKFTAEMVRNKEDRDQFDKVVRRLCRLGCRKSVLFYCLSRGTFAPGLASKVPSPASVRKLAKRMENLAAEIARIEKTGLLDPLDERELSGNLDAIIRGTHVARFVTLPATLRERAAMYARWAGRLPGKSGRDLRLRRDLLSRVNRLSLSVYVKLATNNKDVPEPLARNLVVALMRSAGMSADKSQLRRELRDFEQMHFQAEGALRDKLKRLHDAACRKKGTISDRLLSSSP